MFTIYFVLMVALLPLTASCQILSYQEAYENTKVGEVEIKTVAASKTLVTEDEGEYFDEADDLFMRLFRYIKANDVEMTVPVEAHINNAKMVFYVGSKDLHKNLENRGEVIVKEAPERTVVSLGVRGSYSKENFEEAREKLEDWFKKQERFVKNGEAYAVFWNGPFMPGFMKRFEVHIPVRPTETSSL